jgi:hypothetical protein
MHQDQLIGAARANVVARDCAATAPGTDAVCARAHACACLLRVQVGESPVLTAIAEHIEEAIQRESRVGTVLEARAKIWLVDSKVWGGWIFLGSASAACLQYCLHVMFVLPAVGLATL